MGAMGADLFKYNSSLSGTEYGGSIPVRPGLLAVGTEANKGRSSFPAEPLARGKALDLAVGSCHEEVP